MSTTISNIGNIGSPSTYTANSTAAITNTTGLTLPILFTNPHPINTISLKQTSDGQQIFLLTDTNLLYIYKQYPTAMTITNISNSNLLNLSMFGQYKI